MDIHTYTECLLNFNFMILMCRFDGKDFLERHRGQKIMFVGDSLSNNIWQSLTCMLYSAVPNSKYTTSQTKQLFTFSFPVSSSFLCKPKLFLSFISFHSYLNQYTLFVLENGISKEERGKGKKNLDSIIQNCRFASTPLWSIQFRGNYTYLQ